jgi:hypothetical protein
MSSKKTISEEDDRAVHLQYTGDESLLVRDNSKQLSCEAISFVWQYVGSDVLYDTLLLYKIIHYCPVNFRYGEI